MNTEENKKIMAQNIQRYMDKKGVTRQQVCDALGIRYTTFRDWVKGITYPRIGKVEAMADYFGCEKSDLIEDKSASELTPADVFAKNLFSYIVESGKTQKEIAEDIGVSQSTLKNWLMAKKYPKAEYIEKLAGYFGILKSDLTEDTSAASKGASSDEIMQQVAKVFGVTYDELMILGQDEKRQELISLAKSLSNEQLALVLRIAHSVVIED